MNVRERYCACLDFKPVDRLPRMEWATWWDKTVENWKNSGLHIKPVEGLDEGQALQLQLGLDLHLQQWISFTTEKTPQPAHHGAPVVTSIEEYEAILHTLYPEVPCDPEVLKTYAAWQRRGEAAVWITLDGPFWGPRKLMGITEHLMGFYDKPELMHRINRDLCAYNLRVIDYVCQYVTPDFMTFGEDMSYNNGPMISEQLFDEFMLPYYQVMVPQLKKRGIRVLVDSDGDITRALPWFLKAGIQGVLPLERQAGVDLEALRRQYPQAVFIGHYDKMVMDKGDDAIRAEWERLLPVMRQGGFIPSVDHQTPPGVELREYCTYLRMMWEYSRKGRPQR